MARRAGAIGPGYLPKGGRRVAVEMNNSAATRAAEDGAAVPAGRAGARPQGRARVALWLTTERLAWIGAITGTVALLTGR